MMMQQDELTYSRCHSFLELDHLYHKANVRNFICLQEFERVSSTLSAQNDEENTEKFVDCISQTSAIFRESLRTVTVELSTIAEAISNNDSKAEDIIPVLETQHTILQNVLQFWNLIEIFSLSSSKFVAFDVIEWLQCEQFSVPEYYEHFSSLTHPERYEAAQWSFWDCVYEMVLQGQLSIAVEFLKLHSEFASFFRTSSEHAYSVLSQDHVFAFFSLLESYPYLSFVVPNSESVTHSGKDLFRQRYAQQHNLPAEFAVWAERIAEFRSMKSEILLKIPEIDFLLRLLLGESRAIEVQSRASWKMVALGQLLYQFPATQMTKVNLRRILDGLIEQYEKSTDGVTEIFRSIMVGNVGKMMKMVYEYSTFPHCDDSACGAKEFSVFLLLQLVHLSRLLVVGGKVVELATPLPLASCEASFFEEVALQCTEALQGLGYSHEIIRQYLLLCPHRGRDFYRVFLVSRPVRSDEDCLSVAEALRSEQFFPEAREVLVTRGSFWLKRTRFLALRESIAFNRKAYGWASVSSSTLAKAAYFFFMAKDFARVELLLETAFYRCAHAVVECSFYFQQMLSIFPGPPVPPQRPGALESNCSQQNVMEEDGQDTSELREIRESEEKSENLDYALREAEAIVTVLETLLPSTPEDALTARPLLDLFTALRAYSQAISLVLVPTSNPPNASLRKAAESVAAILVPNPLTVQRPIVSVRYWMHLLELAYFVHQKTVSLELKQSLDQSFLKECETVITNQSFDGEYDGVAASQKDRGEGKGPSLPPRFGLPVYSKEVVAQFHLVVGLLETFPDRQWIYTITKSSELTRKQMKMNLFSLLTSAYLLSSHQFFASSPSQTSASTPPSNLLSPSTASFSDLQQKLEKEKHQENEESRWQFQGHLSTGSEGHNGGKAFLFSYSTHDLMDGSAFLALDLDG